MASLSFHWSHNFTNSPLQAATGANLHSVEMRDESADVLNKLSHAFVSSRRSDPMISNDTPP